MRAGCPRCCPRVSRALPKQLEHGALGVSGGDSAAAKYEPFWWFFYTHLWVNNCNCPPLLRRCLVLYSTGGECGFIFTVEGSVAYLTRSKRKGRK